MTGQAAAIKQVWVLDAMCLSHFARAERLDVLRDLLVDKECWGLRLPCTGAEFPGYARQHGLL
jgi:hypothetical protein